MRRVIQKGSRDCFFASVCMASGMTWAALGKKVGYDTMFRVGDGGSGERIINGLVQSDVRKILNAAGFEEGKNIHHVWCAPGYVGTAILRSMLWGRKAIISILCSGSDDHAVYWDGAEIHDPMDKVIVQKLSDIHHIHHVFLIKD